MRLDNSEKQSSGLTLTEVLAVIVVVVVVAGLLLPSLRHHGGVHKIKCVNNLKQIGLAMRIFATDNSERFPMEVPAKEGGSKEFVPFGLVVPHFLVVSNELTTPKLLVCRHDKRQEAANFNELRSENISYFLGLDAKESEPQVLLAGDRNLMTNGVPVRSRFLEVTTNLTVGWTAQLHNSAGNVLFGDGHVDALSNNRLQQQLIDSGVATNRLLIP